MANLRLKKSILEVVDNQLKANDPPCTKDAYEKLVAAGYSKSEAKDKIGAVVLTEIYDILKKGQAFDEERYRSSLEDMLGQSIDYGDDHHIRTEWDEWDELVQKGYESFEEKKTEEGLRIWREAWDIFESAMKQFPETGTLYALMESQDYVYPIEGWLQDYDMELGNAEKYGERIAFCQKILEMFDWQDEDDGCFRCGIGESLFLEGKIEDAYEYYENWLADDPQNIDGVDSFSWILLENGDVEKSYEVIRKVTWGVSCSMFNSLLFMRAKHLADYIGKEDESRWYRQQLDKFENLIKKWKMDDDESFDEFTVQNHIPIVKERKIYPNDACPCGSGKKYKKCCGKNSS